MKGGVYRMLTIHRAFEFWNKIIFLIFLGALTFSGILSD